MLKRLNGKPCKRFLVYTVTIMRYPTPDVQAALAGVTRTNQSLTLNAVLARARLAPA